MNMVETPLFANIQQLMPTLSPTLTQLAGYIRENPQQVVRLTVTDLALQAQVSVSSVSRLCRELGYRSYAEFKLALTLECGQQEAPDQGPEPYPVFNEVDQALRLTKQLIDEPSMERFVSHIHHARQITVLGVGASSIVADYLSYRLLRLGKRVTCYQDMHLAAISASQFDHQDTLVVVSSSGSTKDVLHAVKVAHQTDCAILALSNVKSSPLSELADYQLVAAAAETAVNGGALAGKVGSMVLVDVLVSKMLAISGYQDAVVESANAVTDLLV